MSRDGAALAAALLLVTLARPVAAQRAADSLPAFDAARREALRAELQRAVDSSGIASLTVGIARDGVVLWTASFGHADLAARRAATPETPYAIASISKPMTATAVLRLAEQGRLALDRPIDEYLGDMRLTSRGGDRSEATVGRVLSHTAGLPLHWQFFYPGRPEAPDVARTVARYGIVVFPPGQVYSYSNLGYGLLGDVVARVAGTSWADYLREHLFVPLGMRDAAVGTGAGIARAAVRYDGEHRVIPPYDFDHRGASAVFASANDLLRFATFHLGRRPSLDAAGWTPPLADSTVAAMQRVATPGDSSAGYGLGWAVDREFGVRRVWHTGSMPGVSTVLAMYPDQGLAVVALANQHSPLPRRVATRLAAAVLPRSFADSLRARRAAPAENAARFAAPAELRGEWQGRVRTHDGTFPIALRVDSLRAQVRLGAAGHWTALENGVARGRLLGGRVAGRMPTSDAGRVPHAIGLSLYLLDDALRGWASAFVEAESDDYALSSYAELRRVSRRITVQKR